MGHPTKALHVKPELPQANKKEHSPAKEPELERTCGLCGTGITEDMHITVANCSLCGESNYCKVCLGHHIKRHVFFSAKGMKSNRGFTGHLYCPRGKGKKEAPPCTGLVFTSRDIIPRNEEKKAKKIAAAAAAAAPAAGINPPGLVRVKVAKPQPAANPKQPATAAAANWPARAVPAAPAAAIGSAIMARLGVGSEGAGTESSANYIPGMEPTDDKKKGRKRRGANKAGGDADASTIVCSDAGRPGSGSGDDDIANLADAIEDDDYEYAYYTTDGRPVEFDVYGNPVLPGGSVEDDAVYAAGNCGGISRSGHLGTVMEDEWQAYDEFTFTDGVLEFGAQSVSCSGSDVVPSAALSSFVPAAAGAVAEAANAFDIAPAVPAPVPVFMSMEEFERLRAERQRAAKAGSDVRAASPTPLAAPALTPAAAQDAQAPPPPAVKPATAPVTAAVFAPVQPAALAQAAIAAADHTHVQPQQQPRFQMQAPMQPQQQQHMQQHMQQQYAYGYQPQLMATQQQQQQQQPVYVMMHPGYSGMPMQQIMPAQVLMQGSVPQGMQMQMQPVQLMPVAMQGGGATMQQQQPQAMQLPPGMQLIQSVQQGAAVISAPRSDSLPAALGCASSNASSTITGAAPPSLQQQQQQQFYNPGSVMATKPLVMPTAPGSGSGSYTATGSASHQLVMAGSTESAAAHGQGADEDADLDDLLSLCLGN